MRESTLDQPNVIEVLCAFVRTHAAHIGRPPDDVPPSPPDVQAAVLVLARRPRPMGEGNPVLDFSGTVLGLPGADLRDANLHRAQLRAANLDEANLTRAILGEVGLIGASLRSADLSNAHLNKADLIGANLLATRLVGADLSDADLYGANLTGANLSGANLSGANLSCVDLSSADLSAAIGLSTARMGGVTVDDDTRLPATIPRPSPATAGC